MGDEDNNEADVQAAAVRSQNALKSKVGVGGPSAADLAALEKAEAVIANMGDSYLEWVEEDLAKISRLLEELKAAKDGGRDILDPMFQISHDMKGQGGSFDYQLMTTLGYDLCRLIEKMDSAGPHEIEVIELYIDAMKLVISKRMQGTGGEPGEQLLAGLDQVLAKVTKE
jgi:HPt (histidine-containing phosphotransfer) domain-containing protein